MTAILAFGTCVSMYLDVSTACLRTCLETGDIEPVVSMLNATSTVALGSVNGLTGFAVLVVDGRRGRLVDLGVEPKLRKRPFSSRAGSAGVFFLVTIRLILTRTEAQRRLEVGEPTGS